MTCPHSNRDVRGSRRVDNDRREFLKAAVSIGGVNALSACLDREDEPVERGDGDLPGVRQHSWREYLDRNDEGVPVPPRHHLLLLCDYTDDSAAPSQEEREKLESSLRGLESAYRWGNEGLLFTVGYSRRYFELYEGEGPEHPEIPAPGALSQLESPSLDRYHVSLHLASDRASALLGAEEALFGVRERANGVRVEDVSDVLSVEERRTGFVGEGLPAENQAVDGIPEGDPVSGDSPLFMGFHSQNKATHDGYEERFYDDDVVLHNQPTEDEVTIEKGGFSGGTTQQVSKIRLELDDWYGMSLERRLGRMFDAPLATDEGVREVGETASTAFETRPFEDETRSHAEDHGFVGHAEKAARSREEGRPIILRRDFNTTDDGQAGVHFVSLQEEIADFVKVRSVMTGSDLVEEHEAIGERENNGILEFMEVENRGNYLVPPRQLRALPPPEPERDNVG